MTEINTREVAEQLITDAIEDIEYLTISEQLDDYGLSPEEAERTAKEIALLIEHAHVQVSLPEATGS